MIFLTVSGNHEDFVNRGDLETFKEAMQQALPDDDPSLFLRIQKAEKGSPTTFYEMHLTGPATLLEEMEIKGKKFFFNISPSSFFQPNTVQAEKLYEKSLEFVNPQPSMRVYDLYAGCGSIGMVFAPYVKKVIGIELCAYAVCDGETNLESNAIENMQLIRGDVGEVLSEFQLPADLVIVDPPRSGLDEKAIHHVIRLDPKKILYISCNPETQSKNIFDFVKAGYQLAQVQPVDQFPHTPHIENICLLEK